MSINLMHVDVRVEEFWKTQDGYHFWFTGTEGVDVNGTGPCEGGYDECTWGDERKVIIQAWKRVFSKIL